MNETAHKILDAAERLTQLSGINAFSYKDLQVEVGVKTSTIHYYFPSKQDLALSMTNRYIDRFMDGLNAIEAIEADGLQRLRALGQIYVKVVGEGKFCLCGMLASDRASVSDEVKKGISGFFETVQSWISQALRLAIEQGSIDAHFNAEEQAGLYLSALEGGMLIARSFEKPGYLQASVNQWFDQL